MRLVEIVPNFSEGRRAEVVREIADAMGWCVLDWSLDADHNRAVITAAGSAEEMAEAALRAAEAAVRLIDVSRHEGVHPRVGALDVLPFVPLTGATLTQCAEIAAEVGEEIWRRLRIPVFLYEAAARTPERKSLAEVRREIRRNAMAIPDIGDAGPHPTAGAVVIGARDFLIAYNVNLASRDVGIAKQIAVEMRRLPGVRALGLWLESAGFAQVSMNLLDFRQTGIAEAFDAVERLARGHGIEVAESELIGLAPSAALNREIATHVRLRDFGEERILEVRLEQRRLK